MAYTDPEIVDRLLSTPKPQPRRRSTQRPTPAKHSSASAPWQCMVCGTPLDFGRIRCADCEPPPLPAEYLRARARLSSAVSS